MMLVPALAGLCCAMTTSSTVASYAVVIGNNHPLQGSGYEMLQYADDDAIRFARFFESLSIDTHLLTIPDRETSQRFPSMSDKATAPTRAHLLKALSTLEEALNAQEGKHREVFFVFSGHGSMSSSEAFLHLTDGPFTRTDLFEHILKRLPVERMHVIIDSCHSFFLVNARGERVAVDENEENVGRFPFAGFLLSTSSRKEVQEWSGYQAGVFSYQVLGALRGAADVDGDSVVTYDEVNGYITNANMDVQMPAARIQPFVRPPTIRGQRLVIVPRGPMLLSLPPSLSGHLTIVDAQQGKVLDAHKPENEALTLLLPRGESMSLVQGDNLYQIRTSSTAMALHRIEAPPGQRAEAKGSIADEFRMNLFKRPLTRDFVSGLSAASRLSIRPPEPAPKWHQSPLTIGALTAGGAFTILGGVGAAIFGPARARANARPLNRPFEELEADRQTARRWQPIMLSGFVAGGALLLTGLIKAIWFDGAGGSLGAAP